MLIAAANPVTGVLLLLGLLALAGYGVVYLRERFGTAVANAGVNGDVSLVARVKDLKAKLAKAETVKNLAVSNAEAAKKAAQDKFDAFKADIDAQLKAADAEITGAAT